MERKTKRKKSKEDKVLAEVVESDMESVVRIWERVNEPSQEDRKKYV